MLNTVASRLASLLFVASPGVYLQVTPLWVFVFWLLDDPFTVFQPEITVFSSKLFEIVPKPSTGVVGAVGACVGAVQVVPSATKVIGVWPPDPLDPFPALV